MVKWRNIITVTGRVGNNISKKEPIIYVIDK
jgi:hypothetical protein